MPNHSPTARHDDKKPGILDQIRKSLLSTEASNPVLIDILIAAVLFLGSTALTEAIRAISVLEFGGKDLTPGSLSGMCRWDCQWYRSVIAEGYHSAPKYHAAGDAANWPFFPAFPLFAKGIHLITGLDASAALVASSKILFFLSIATFIGFGRYITDRRTSLYMGCVLSFSPCAIYAHSGYAEPMYLWLTTISFWLLEKRSWIASGATGAILSATRVVGAGFAASYAATLLRRDWRKRIKSRSDFTLGLLLIPAGLATYMYYLYAQTGDALAFWHAYIAWGQQAAGNLEQRLWNIAGQGLWGWYYAFVVILCAATVIWHFRKGRPELAVFLIVTSLLPVTTSASLVSFPRYIFWQMPFMLAIGDAAARCKSLAFIYTIYAASMTTIMTLAWFKGNVFVI
jgi:hypothetical protein